MFCYNIEWPKEALCKRALVYITYIRALFREQIYSHNLHVLLVLPHYV